MKSRSRFSYALESKVSALPPFRLPAGAGTGFRRWRHGGPPARNGSPPSPPPRSPHLGPALSTVPRSPAPSPASDLPSAAAVVFVAKGDARRPDVPSPALPPTPELPLPGSPPAAKVEHESTAELEQEIEPLGEGSLSPVLAVTVAPSVPLTSSCSSSVTSAGVCPSFLYDSPSLPHGTRGSGAEAISPASLVTEPHRRRRTWTAAQLRVTVHSTKENALFSSMYQSTTALYAPRNFVNVLPEKPQCAGRPVSACGH